MDFFSATAPQCQTNDRVECGYLGINEAQCEYRGCCWSPTTASGQTWCYYEKGNVLLKSHNPSKTQHGHHNCTLNVCIFIYILLYFCAWQITMQRIAMKIWSLH